MIIFMMNRWRICRRYAELAMFRVFEKNARSAVFQPHNVKQGKIGIFTTYKI